MSDRELLELAAKASGHQIDPIDAAHEPEAWFSWNPLADDGDALRLAALFGLKIIGPKHMGDGCTVESQQQNIAGCTVFRDDAAEQMRRAIVHVAAEIGKSMP